MKRKKIYQYLYIIILASLTIYASVYCYFNLENFLLEEVTLLILFFLIHTITNKLQIKIDTGINIHTNISLSLPLVILTEPLIGFIFNFIKNFYDVYILKSIEERPFVKFIFNTSLQSLTATLYYVLFYSFIQGPVNFDFKFVLVITFLMIFISIVNKLFFIIIIYTESNMEKVKNYNKTILKQVINVLPHATPMNMYIIYFYMNELYIAFIISFITHMYLMYSFKKMGDLKKSKLDLEAYKEVSLKDELTKVYNPRFLNFELDIIEKNREDMAMVMIDIDDFKPVNDTYNHQLGDKILIQFANIIKENLHRDDFLIRYGGEEFTIFIRNLSFEDSKNLMENIRKKIGKNKFKANYKNKEINLRITASMGLYYYRKDDPLTPKQALEEADNLLYHSKRNGKNRITTNKDII